MSSTDTSESLIQRAMNRPLTEKLSEKSVRLKQATEAILASDSAAGLAENRRTNKAYNQQSDRATKAMVDKWIKGNGAMPQDDDDTVITDLGDRYTENHYHGEQGAKPSVAKGLLAKALPWLLAAALVPLSGIGGALLTKYMGGGSDVNVKDVQSKFKVEVYDENGTLIETLPYSELPAK